MRKLEINIFFGFSIILKYVDIFEQLIKLKVYDSIFFCLDKNTFQSYRNTYSLDYYNESENFCNKIINNNNIIYQKNKNYELIDLPSLLNKTKLKVNFILNYKLINNKVYDNPYITLSQKILNLPEKDFNLIKYKLIDYLNKISLKYFIVLMGEKKIDNCTEYNIHETYTIYNFIIKNVNKDKIIDITYDICSNVDSVKFDNFTNSTSIMRYSELNIFFGDAGISEILHFSSKNILGVSYNRHELINLNKDIDNNINVFNNFNDFFIILNKYII